jgi:argininosuccinate lyase
VFTVENINQLIQSGTPFRTAYKQVGLAVEDGSYVPHKEFHTTHLGSVHNLGLEEIQAKVQRLRQKSELVKE